MLLTRPSDTCKRHNLPCILITIFASASFTASSISCKQADSNVAFRILGQHSISTSAIGGADNHPPNRVKLRGAINETVEFRFALETRERVIEKPQLRTTPLSHANAEIATSTIELFRMHPVQVETWPGWHIRSIPPRLRNPKPNDVLVPVNALRGGLPEELPPGQSYSFWADVHIPKGTADGTYQGQIELVSGKEVLARLDIELTVWPFILPDEADVDVIVNLDHRPLFDATANAPADSAIANRHLQSESENSGRQMESTLTTMRLLRSHRLTPVLPFWQPATTVTAQAQVRIDWHDFDALVEKYLSGEAYSSRYPQKFWPFPAKFTLDVLRASDSSHVGESRGLIQSYLALCAEHFQAKGWLDRSYLGLVDPMPLSRQTDALESKLFSAARSTGKGIQTLSRFFSQDAKEVGWLQASPPTDKRLVDVWMPRTQFFDVETMANERAAGRKTWFAVDRPPFSGSLAIQAPSSFVRVLGWQGLAMGADVIHAGWANRHPADNHISSQEDTRSRFDENLLYPGGSFDLEKPVPSTRLKYLRRSLQDVSYHRLLREHGLTHVSDATIRSIVSYAGTSAYRTHFADGKPIGWITDDSVFDLAREIMAEALIRKTQSQVDETTSSITKNLKWRQFMTATRRVHLRSEGVRLAWSGHPGRHGMDVEIAIRVFNHTRVPLSGTLQIRSTEGIASWEPAAKAVSNLQPNDARIVRLRTYLSPQANGDMEIWPFPLEFILDSGKTMFLTAFVRPVTADTTHRPIKIDGDLSDWPLGIGNVLANFKLVSTDATSDGNETHRKPSKATRGFVLRDDKYLYVSLNCQLSPNTKTPRRRHNRVIYDDLVPRHDELIEILIDPLNARTRSPADLYRIAVKFAGTNIAERGIRTDPPCGVWVPWPVDLEVATSHLDNRWVAEIKIPLEAFGPGAADRAIWGFNVTRFDMEGQEFSSWSGASPNPYDPLSLGNLVLP